MRFHGTTVTFVRRSDGALIGYRATGHTGYAEAGEDIVCAGVSMLAQTLALTLEDTPGADARTHTEAGELTLSCAETPQTRELFRMCRIGFGALAERYGAWVSLEEGGETSARCTKAALCSKAQSKK